MYCNVLYYTVLYCTALYCTMLYCTVLYCTVFRLLPLTLGWSCFNYTILCWTVLNCPVLRDIWAADCQINNWPNYLTRNCQTLQNKTVTYLGQVTKKIDSRLRKKAAIEVSRSIFRSKDGIVASRYNGSQGTINIYLL